MSESAYRKFEQYFWWAYVLLPIFTGLLHYTFLPNESYDEKKHELIAASSADTNPVGGSVDVPQAWQSKASGEVYTRDFFAKHRHRETLRISAVTFLYGLIGCFFFSYGQVLKERESFINAFKSSLLYDVGASLLPILFYWS
jgi:hypothetical protein